MNGDQLIAYIRKPANDPSVTALLASFGVQSVPVVKKGDTNVYVDLPEKGLYFIFTDEGFLEKRPNAKIGEKPPILSNVTFNTSAMAPYATYGEALPWGLSFSHTRDQMRAALGAPEFSMDARKMDRWRKDDLWIFAIYAADFSSVQRITVQCPNKT